MTPWIAVGMKAMNHYPAFRSLDRFTQQEFARWLEDLPPGDLHHHELLDGFIVREPPAGWPHGEIAVCITSYLGPFVREQALGRVFDSSQGFDLPTGDTVEPDVSFVSTQRWKTLRTPVHGFPRVAPNLIFEILSPSTKRLDRTRKKRIYARNHVEEYVLVDPTSRTLERFAIAGVGEPYGTCMTIQVGDIFESLALPGFSLPVVDVFPDS